MPNEIKEQFLKNIIQDSDRLGRMINNILDFEKLETGRLSLNLTKNDIQKTINRSISGLSQLAAKKEIQMMSHNVHSFELEYDEDRILQVFTNLISNALKFVEPNGGKITVDFKMGNNELEISVSDNGKGIPAEDHDYIFDKFYQSKHQNTIKPQGSGLGLAITKQIVDKHRGKLWAVRNRKEGACLVFTLPFK